MKKNILSLVIFSFVLFSCDKTSGGNKNILPTNSSDIKTSLTDSKVEVIHSKTDSIKDETNATVNGIISDSIKNEAKKVPSK